MTLLWPERDGQQARHPFNIVVWRLRKLYEQHGVAGEDFVHSNRERVAFVPKRPFRFDQDEFLRLTTAGLAEKQLAQREAVLKQALALWKGVPFSGLYTTYCLERRERLELLRIEAWRQLLADCYAKRAYAEAIDWGNAILREDSLREQVHCELMRCYVALGQPVLAVRQYQRCAEIMERELGIRPFSATQQLYRQIVEG